MNRDSSLCFLPHFSALAGQGGGKGAGCLELLPGELCRSCHKICLPFPLPPSEELTEKDGKLQP